MAFVNGRTAREYAYPAAKIRNTTVKEAKMRASTELDNLLEAGTNFRTEPDGRDGHFHPRSTGDFRYFDTLFRVGDRYYSGVINIEQVEKGLLLKDVTKIKDVTSETPVSYGQNPKYLSQRTSSMDSISNPAEKGNPKFSLKNIAPAATVDMRAVMRENERLKRAVDTLSAEFQLTKGHHVSEQGISRVAREVLGRYESTYDPATFRENLRRMFDYLGNAEQPAWEDVADMGVRMMKEVLNESAFVDKEHEAEVKDLREYLKNTTVRITPYYMADAEYLGGGYFSEFRKQLLGTVKVSRTKGISIDDFFAEIGERWPHVARAARGDGYASKKAEGALRFFDFPFTVSPPG